MIKKEFIGNEMDAIYLRVERDEDDYLNYDFILRVNGEEVHFWNLIRSTNFVDRGYKESLEFFDRLRIYADEAIDELTAHYIALKEKVDAEPKDSVPEGESSGDPDDGSNRADSGGAADPYQEELDFDRGTDKYEMYP
jgi:hypothetical protein